MQTARLGLPRALAAIAPGALLALAAGCLDPESDLLDGDPGSPADVDGVWMYSVDVENAIASCAADGITLAFDQEDLEFSGSASGSELVCQLGDESSTDSIGIRPILNGNVRGRVVGFAIGDDNWIHVGEVSEDGDSIIGQAEIVRDFPNISRQTMQGPFEAHRQTAP
ncbi:MAG: hypothetical protein ACREMD_01645 [Gemmatimonadota bacterium]